MMWTLLASAVLSDPAKDSANSVEQGREKKGVEPQSHRVHLPHGHLDAHQRFAADAGASPTYAGSRDQPFRRRYRRIA
jgi:hypothetical protein